MVSFLDKREGGDITAITFACFLSKASIDGSCLLLL